MSTVTQISGSLRRGSVSTALLRTAVALMPAGNALKLESIESIPLYNGDVKAAAGIPQRVAALKKTITIAGGVLLSTPEYNNSIRAIASRSPYIVADDWRADNACLRQ